MNKILLIMVTIRCWQSLGSDGDVGGDGDDDDNDESFQTETDEKIAYNMYSPGSQKLENETSVGLRLCNRRKFIVMLNLQFCNNYSMVSHTEKCEAISTDFF